MIPELRDLFNLQFKESNYKKLLDSFKEKFNCDIPFRVAETPIFFTPALKSKLILAGEEILTQLLEPALLKSSIKGIPEDCFVPGDMGNSNCLALDFAITEGDNGELMPKLIELQGFPSLYNFQAELSKTYLHYFSLPGNLQPFFNGLNENTYQSFLSKVILGNCKPEEVILLEIDPWNQATAIDFAIFKDQLGIEVVDLKDLIIDHKKVFYKRGNSLHKVKRIYNRVIFDELKQRKDLISEFHLTEEVEVEWVVHPNWYFRYSKYILPLLKGSYVPETYYLQDLKTFPQDLENYVLKPLYSFSGTGVIFHLQPGDLENIKDKKNYILQKKVSYLPIIKSVDKKEETITKVKMEVRLLYLWNKEDDKPTLVINLCRLSRGDMIGVKFNRDKNWVGGSVALFE